MSGPPPQGAFEHLVDDDGHPPCCDAVACGACVLLSPLTPELAATIREMYEADIAGLAWHPRRPEPERIGA